MEMMSLGKMADQQLHQVRLIEDLPILRAMFDMPSSADFWPKKTTIEKARKTFCLFFPLSSCQESDDSDDSSFDSAVFLGIFDKVPVCSSHNSCRKSRIFCCSPSSKSCGRNSLTSQDGRVLSGSIPVLLDFCWQRSSQLCEHSQVVEGFNVFLGQGLRNPLGQGFSLAARKIRSQYVPMLHLWWGQVGFRISERLHFWGPSNFSWNLNDDALNISTTSPMSQEFQRLITGSHWELIIFHQK